MRKKWFRGLRIGIGVGMAFQHSDPARHSALGGGVHDVEILDEVFELGNGKVFEMPRNATDALEVDMASIGVVDVVFPEGEIASVVGNRDRRVMSFLLLL
jgi:hypothetical protein